MSLPSSTTSRRGHLVALHRRAAAYRLRGRGVGRLTGRTTRVTVETIWMARKRMFFSSEKAVCELGYRWRAPAKAFEDAVLRLREQELL